ncbi:L-aspartate oxidase [Swaminathania salitolerans]|uniref:L-aspartate oxidase n=1 Tax=Swaminathania salitolerans TaxID=182838 RepID=A0A511BTX3_9PROT|nr:L-aspartate oxidase [Swaminathania salitolerans]GBQ12945.1 succinate dehydrogenase flavoprotein subunit [Swaminathania salitolerans LMG 21291]GEL03223.1 L-aspartate oxidase [Swaminathania salitolerans]
MTLTRFAGWPVIAGAGLAGLTAALHLDRPCVVLTPSPLGEEAASMLAQGGLAAAIGQDDSIALHVRDTLAAGDGLCVPEAVQAIVEAGPSAIGQLLDWGVSFARRGETGLDLHLEAAHSRARIAHVDGDASGAGIMRALIAQLRKTPRIVVLEGVSLAHVETCEGRVVGVWLNTGQFLPTNICILASGGAGALYANATSPRTNSGGGLAAAARAGAVLADMEFVQFHPTALDVETGEGRAPLISEAVRGAGAKLVDEKGAWFTDPLQSRDRVARAIAAHRDAGHKVFLDARSLSGSGRGAAPNGATRRIFSAQFPGIARLCAAHGIDPDRELIPVRPAVHYHMGGVETDLHGRTSLAGLWACGEVACTGLHGANRLASNSLLEAFVMGRAAAWDVNNAPRRRHSCQNPVMPRVRTAASFGPQMDRGAGILRDADGLQALISGLTPLAGRDDHALIGTAIATAALRRRESRGSHWRSDYPAQGEAFRIRFTLADIGLQAHGTDAAQPECMPVEMRHPDEPACGEPASGGPIRKEPGRKDTAPKELPPKERSLAGT